MYEQKEEDEQSAQIMQRAKIIFFDLLYELLSEVEELPELVFRLLTLVETLQLMWFTIHTTLNILPTSAFLVTTSQSFLQDLNLASLAVANDFLFTIILIALTAWLSLNACALGMVAWMVSKGMPVNGILKKVLSLSLVGTCKVLTLPTLNIALMLVNCSGNKLTTSCSGASYAVGWMCGVVAVGVVLATNVLYGSSFFIKYPVSRSWLARQNNLEELFKFMLKVLLSVYFLVDPSMKYKVIYMAGLLGVLAGYLFLLRLPGYNSYVHACEDFTLLMEGFLFFQAANMLLLQQLGSNSYYSFLYALLTALLFANVLLRLRKMQNAHLLHELAEPNFKKHHMEKALLLLFSQALQIAPGSQLSLQTLFKFICHNLNSEQELSVEHGGKKGMSMFLPLVEEMMKESPTPLTKIIWCYLMVKSGKVVYALQKSIAVSKEKLDFHSEFTMSYFRRREHIYVRSTDEESFTLYFQANEESLRFQKLIKKATLNMIEYWEQLKELSPSIGKVLMLANAYREFMEQIEDSFDRMCALPVSCIYMTNLYLGFLTEVCENYKESIKAREKLAQECEKHFKEMVEEEEFGQGREVVITIDTVGDELGVMVNCNMEIKPILKFDRRDLIGKNVTIIMPKFFVVDHDRHIQNFLQAKKGNSSASRNIYPISEDSSFVPMLVTLKMYSNSYNRLLIVGLMRISQKDSKMLIDVETLKIEAVNREFQRLIEKRIRSKGFYEDKIFLNSIFVGGDLKNLKEGEQIEGDIEISQQGKEQSDFKKAVLLKVQRVIQYGLKTIAAVSVREKIQMVSLPTEKGLTINKQKRMSKSTRGTTMLIKSPYEELGISNIQEKKDLERDLEVFIDESEREANKMQIASAILLLGFMLFVFLCSYFRFANLLAFSADISAIYAQMSACFDILIDQGTINLLSSQIYHNSTGLASRQALLATTVISYRASLSALLGAVYNSSSLLTLNEDIVLGVQEFVGTTPVQYPLQYLDALQQYGSSAAALALTVTLERYLFVVRNGRQNLPDKLLITTQQYLDLSSWSFGNYEWEMYIIDVGSSCLYVLVFACATFFTYKISKFNKVVISIYNLIRIWDAAEISLKSSVFLNKHQKQQRQVRSSQKNILSIFPYEVLLQLTGEVEEHQPLETNCIKLTIVDPLKQQKKWAVVIILLITASFVYTAFRHQFGASISTSMGDQHRLGDIHKSLKFILFFSYESMQSLSTDDPATYRALLTTQLLHFYDSTREGYTLVNDVLLEIYSRIEAMKAALDMPSPPITLYNELESSVALCEVAIQQTSNALHTTFLEALSGEMTFLLVKLGLEIGACVALCLALFYYVLGPIVNLSKSQVNMIRTIPSWLIERNQSVQIMLKKM